MMRRRADEIVIPEGKTAEEALQIWVDDQLGADDQDVSTEKEFSISQCAYNFCVRYSGKDAFISSESLNYWKRSYVRALMERGLTLKRDSAGMSPFSRRDFLNALKLIPENPLACYRLGHLMLKKQNLGETIAYFARALDLSRNQQDYFEMLKISELQTQVAKELLLDSLNLLNKYFSKDEKTFEDSETDSAMAVLSKQKVEATLFYTKKSGGRTEDKRITMDEYYALLNVQEENPSALIIDRLSLNPYIRYLAKDQPLSENHRKLHYLLYCLGLEISWDDASLASYDSIRRTVSRLNQNLRDIGIPEDTFKVRYTLAEKFHTVGSIDIHYFRSIYHN